MSADQLADLRLQLHPSVVLLKSRFPVVSIWEANLYANDNAIGEWRPESALVARPDLRRQVHRLTAGGYEFFAALAERRTVGSAIASAMAEAPDFDLASCFTTLIAADIVVGFVAPHDVSGVLKRFKALKYRRLIRRPCACRSVAPP